MKKRLFASIAALALSGCAISDDFIEAASQAQPKQPTRTANTAQKEIQKDWDSLDRYRKTQRPNASATGIK